MDRKRFKWGRILKVRNKVLTLLDYGVNGFINSSPSLLHLSPKIWSSYLQMKPSIMQDNRKLEDEGTNVEVDSGPLVWSKSAKGTTGGRGEQLYSYVCAYESTKSTYFMDNLKRICLFTNSQESSSVSYINYQKCFFNHC